MKPNNVKLGVAITAATFALSACDPLGTFENLSESIVNGTRNSIKRVDASRQANMCLERAQLGFTLKYLGAETDRTFSALKFQCQTGHIYTKPSTCEIMVLHEDEDGNCLRCFDYDGNGEWDDAWTTKDYCMSDRKGLTIAPADQVGNPEKWQSFQAECKDAFYQCLAP